MSQYSCSTCNKCKCKCNSKSKSKTCNPIVINLYIASISQIGGPNTGGNTVTISGCGFFFVEFINIGNTKITTFDVINDNEISFVVPPMNNTTNVKIYVAASNCKTDITLGKSNTVCYTYVDQPTITNIVSNNGPINGGNNVTINGNNLSSTQSIKFGSTTVNSFMVINNNKIVFNVPVSNLLVGNSVNVYVETLGGNSNMLSYSYILPPMI